MKYFRITELHRQRDKKVTGRVGEADRRVPRQPNVFIGTDGKVARYLLYFDLLNNMISYYLIVFLNKSSQSCIFLTFVIGTIWEDLVNYHFIWSTLEESPIFVTMFFSITIGFMLRYLLFQLSRRLKILPELFESSQIIIRHYLKTQEMKKFYVR